MEYNRKKQSSEKGFALAAALMACAILFALAMLIIQLSTGDLKVSSKNVGDKKAASAAESGLHSMIQSFDPAPSTWTAANNYTTNCAATTPTYIWLPVASGADPDSEYAICAPAPPTSGPVSLPMPGYSSGGGKTWVQTRFIGRVVGHNKKVAYQTKVEIDTGVGYGPVPSGTQYE